MILKKHLPPRRVTQPPKHYFFGYFDKFPWSSCGRYLLAQQSEFSARQPQPGEKLKLGLIDLQDYDRFTPLAENDAWCWQQGCMFQWLPGSDSKVVYNDREEDTFVARILDVKSGETKTLCRPVYCLSPDGKWALSLNFSRLDREREGYGYPGGRDPFEKINCPEEDGVFLLDLENNQSKLIVSVAQISESYFRSDMENTPGWFNHMLFSPDSQRFAFFHRWRLWDKEGRRAGHKTHMFTADLQGKNIWPLNLENMSSHYVWTSNNTLINFSNRYSQGWQYYHYRDQTHKTEIVAQDVFPGDGHCSYSSDQKWMLTDSYPLEDNCRRLYLYDLREKQAYEIGSFFADPAYPLPTRCDLHPNWSRDDSFVCIDSIHEGSRQMYILDVREFTKK